MQVQGFSDDEVSDGFDEADEISVRTNSLADSELRGRPVHLAPLVCTDNLKARFSLPISSDMIVEIQYKEAWSR